MKGNNYVQIGFKYFGLTDKNLVNFFFTKKNILKNNNVLPEYSS